MTPRRDDDGFTLAELLVTMMVFSMMVIALTRFATQSYRLYGANNNRIVTGEQASRVMAQLSRDLRTAIEVGPPATSVAFYAASPTAVSFYTSVSGGPVRERLYIDAANRLQRETTLPDTGSTGPAYTYATNRGLSTSRVTADVVPSTVLFTYVLDGGGSTSTVSTANLGDIVGIRISLTLNADPTGRNKPAVLENTVRPYNLT